MPTPTKPTPIQGEYPPELEELARLARGNAGIPELIAKAKKPENVTNLRAAPEFKHHDRLAAAQHYLEAKEFPLFSLFAPAYQGAKAARPVLPAKLQEMIGQALGTDFKGASPPSMNQLLYGLLPLFARPTASGLPVAGREGELPPGATLRPPQTRGTMLEDYREPTLRGSRIRELPGVSGDIPQLTPDDLLWRNWDRFYPYYPEQT